MSEKMAGFGRKNRRRGRKRLGGVKAASVRRRGGIKRSSVSSHNWEVRMVGSSDNARYWKCPPGHPAGVITQTGSPNDCQPLTKAERHRHLGDAWGSKG